jgi:predicted nucleic acid-binding protein
VEEAGVILVDTNAWIAHLRRADTRLARFLSEQRVRTCDVVIGELLLGSGLPGGFARDLRLLPRLPAPAAAETRAFIERHGRSFAGSGVGWADAQIVHAAAKTGAQLYSADRAVRRLCRALDVPMP